MQLLACQLFGERGEANEGYPGIDSESRRRTGTHPHYQQFQLEGLTPLMQQNEKSWAPPEFLPQAECFAFSLLALFLSLPEPLKAPRA